MGSVTSYTKDKIDSIQFASVVDGEVDVDTLVLIRGDGTRIEIPIPSGGVTQEEVDASIAAAVAALVDASPEALNTLAELAAAIGDNAEFFNTVLLKTLADAKGDLFVGSGPDAVDRLAVGNDDEVLTADATAPFGVKWAPGSPEPSWVMLHGAQLDNMVNGTDYFPSWTDAEDPAASGNDVSFGGATPTEIHIETTGRYSLALYLFAISGTVGQTPKVSGYFMLNDDSAGPFYYFEVEMYPVNPKIARDSIVLPDVHLNAGDVLKLSLHQNGDAGNTTHVNGLYLLICGPK